MKKVKLSPAQLDVLAFLAEPEQRETVIRRIQTLITWEDDDATEFNAHLARKADYYYYETHNIQLSTVRRLLRDEYIVQTARNNVTSRTLQLDGHYSHLEHVEYGITDAGRAALEAAR